MDLSAVDVAAVDLSAVDVSAVGLSAVDLSAVLHAAKTAQREPSVFFATLQQRSGTKDVRGNRIVISPRGPRMK